MTALAAGTSALQQIHKLIFGGFHSPWLDRPDFYRSGLPTRTPGAHSAGTILKFVQVQKTCWRVSEIRAIFDSEAQESLGALTTKNKAKK